jgi:hypothetical protein
VRQRTADESSAKSERPFFVVLVTEEKAFFIAMYGNEANALAWFYNQSEWKRNPPLCHLDRSET